MKSFELRLSSGYNPAAHFIFEYFLESSKFFLFDFMFTEFVMTNEILGLDCISSNLLSGRKSKWAWVSIIIIRKSLLSF